MSGNLDICKRRRKFSSQITQIGQIFYSDLNSGKVLDIQCKTLLVKTISLVSIGNTLKPYSDKIP
jgi:hypothetical protein